MGEPRGKLEALIAELEHRKAETLKVLQEYDLLLPHLQQGLSALDEAGFTDTTPVAEIPVPQAVPPLQEAPPPPPKEVAPEPAEEAAPEPVEAEAEAEAEAEVEVEEEETKTKAKGKKKGEEKAAPAEPARRSIASLVGDDAEKEAAQAK
jgi:hypothetical protein